MKQLDGVPGTGEPDPGAGERDWVEEACKCFLMDTRDIDPTDPAKAIRVYFERNAPDGLKARCKAEGKDAEGCWRFVEAVARRALGGKSGHIDPAVVYALAMHWFEDVPKDWDAAPAEPAKAAKPAGKAKAAKPAGKAKAAKPAGKAKAAKPAGKAKAAKPAGKAKDGKRSTTKLMLQQGFLFGFSQGSEESGGDA